MAPSNRSSSYSNDEDKLLCRIYLDVTQDPITGINQSSQQLWTRVMEEYNSSKEANMEERNSRSLQCRIEVIKREICKFRGCVRQIENLNPSGASETDILNRAKELLMQDEKYKKGFKFDHLWNILKDEEKFKHHAGDKSTKPSTQFPETPTSSPSGLPFSINLSDDNTGSDSSERPTGIKKSKLKRKQEAWGSKVVESIESKAEDLKKLLQKTVDLKEKEVAVKQLKVQMKAKRDEEKILMRDLSTIPDPKVREYFYNEQLRIMQKRAQEEQVQSLDNIEPYANYFQGIGGSGSGLPDY